MISVAKFTFNPYQENTYVLFDETKECLIIDPGMYEQAEKDQMEDFIKNKELKPVRLLNTHCHIDHVLGNKFIAEKYNLKLEAHEKEIPVLAPVVQYGLAMGIHAEQSPEIEKFLSEEDVIEFGNSKLSILFAPGHSPGSICFYSAADNILIGGDVLFKMSIGRTDLPGGDHQTLLNSITQNLWSLPDETIVYPGHMEETSIGFEKRNNPFFG